MTDWQPISTAPKDGTVIDLWIKTPDGGYREPDAHWGNGDLGKGWVTVAGDDQWNLENDGEITHWQPLPSPPGSDS